MGNFGAPLWNWLGKNKAQPLFAGLAFVVVLSLWSKTARYAIPLGVIIMCVWLFKWQHEGGQI